MFKRIRLVPLQQPDGAPAMAGDAGWGSVHNRMTALDERVAAIATHVHEMDMKGMEHGEMLLRISQLEKQMDDMPSRVSNLEKYGSDVTIKLPDEIKALDGRVKDLEEQPQEAAVRIKKRQDWIIVYTAVGGCLLWFISIIVTLLGMLFTYLLAKGII